MPAPLTTNLDGRIQHEVLLSMGGRQRPITSARRGRRIDVQDFARYKGGHLEVEDRIDNLARFSHPAHRLQAGKERGRFTWVRRRLDHAWGDRVHPNAPVGILDNQGARDGVKAALGSVVKTAAMSCSASTDVMLTMWPDPACSIRATARCVKWKNSARFTATVAAKSADTLTNAMIASLPIR